MTVVDHGRKAKIELVNLTLNDSSGVDRGDNPEAHVMMLKRQQEEAAKKDGFWERVKRWAGGVVKYGQPMGPRTVDEIMMAQEFQEEFCELRYAFIDSVYSILDGASTDEMPALITATVEQFAARAKALVAGMNAAPGTENAKRLDGILAALQEKSRETGDVGKRASFAQALKDLEDFDPLELRASAEKAQPAAEEQQMKLADALKNVPQQYHAAIIAAHEAEKATATPTVVVPDATAKALDELKAQFAESQKAAAEENKKLAEQVKILRDESLDSEFMSKAEKFDIVGLETKKVAKHLRAAYAVGKENGDDLSEMFKGLTEQTRFTKRLMDQVGMARQNKGVRTPGPGSNTDAETELEKIAETVFDEAQKSGKPITKQQAFEKAGKANPALMAAAVAGDDGMVEQDG